MEITFKMVNDKEIDIYSGENLIGHIFTPAGSGCDTKNAIQICGFEEAFDYWGCGIFGEKGEADKAVMKKDIQLMFKDYKRAERRETNHTWHACVCCYNDPCTCEQGTQTESGEKSRCPYVPKRSEDLPLETKKYA